MNVIETWEYNSALAKAYRLKAEAYRWDARAHELRGEQQEALDYRKMASSMDWNAAQHELWAREAPDAPGG